MDETFLKHFAIDSATFHPLYLAIYRWLDIYELLQVLAALDFFVSENEFYGWKIAFSTVNMRCSVVTLHFH